MLKEYRPGNYAVHTKALEQEYTLASTVMTRHCTGCEAFTIWLLPELKIQEDALEAIKALQTKNPEMHFAVWKKLSDIGRGPQFLLLRHLPVKWDGGDIPTPPCIAAAWDEREIGESEEFIWQTIRRCLIRQEAEAAADRGIRNLYFAILCAVPPVVVTYHVYYKDTLSWLHPLSIIADGFAIAGIAFGWKAIARLWRAIRLRMKLRLFA